MRLHWRNLNEADQMVYRATMAFLIGRLQERATVDWAIRLKVNDQIKCLAMLDLIKRPGNKTLTEPWGSAWRLIEESWNNPEVEDYASSGIYDAKHRLKAGDRSGSLVTAIVNCVAPKLKVEPISRLDRHFRKPPQKPKKVEDLFTLGLTSGELVDPELLELEKLTDNSFLCSLALALEAVVSNGLEIAQRIGWDEKRQLGQVHRVYYVKASDLPVGMYEPDKFHQGLAPSIKLLHAVVSVLIEIDRTKGIKYIHRWKLSDSPIHWRLWAALSRNPEIATAEEAGKFLVSLDNQRFWDLYDFPEISELRGMRFGEFNSKVQKTLTARIRKLPPRKLWPQKADTVRITNIRHFWALRELRRIEISGATLPKCDQIWLQAKTQGFPALAQMTRLDDGFRSSFRGRLIPQNPDNRYDLPVGAERLKVLDIALSSESGGGDDDPARGARDWMRQQGNSLVILDDFESTLDGGAGFGRVWEWFGWEHSTAERQGGDTSQRDLQSECARVLSLISNLPDTTIRQAINGISHWLSIWENQVVQLPEGLCVWLKIWPIAVEATNVKQRASEQFDIRSPGYSADVHIPKAPDTLNTPVGKLIGVFLLACPTVGPGDTPFQEDNIQRQMRVLVEDSIGQAGLIVKYRLIEELDYFLKADQEWTETNLVQPLLEDTSESRFLWRAVASRTRFLEVLKIIGDQATDRATDQRLDRDTRNSLVFSLIIDCLHAFREERDSAVPIPRVQQMIRSVEDEIRAHGAEAIQQYIRDLSTPSDETPTSTSPDELFRSAAVPFLQQVWPQERSLATPGISRAFADLPAAAKEAFAEAVDAIERFLLPFECWSILDYGLYGEQDGKPKLSIIDNHEKADALLRLLDLTIGAVEGSVIPHDLGDALNHIRRIAPSLEKEKAFRRLSTAARRG